MGCQNILRPICRMAIYRRLKSHEILHIMGYRVLACGSNGKGQLGIGSDEDQDRFQPVKFKDGTAIREKPRAILCGGNHTIILMENGDAYSSGDNTYGQCCLEGDNITEFSKIPGSDWIMGSCGWEFTILINNLYEIYVCGYGMKGELGLGDIKQANLTRLGYDIPQGTRIIDITSSLNHTIMKLSSGQLVGWGSCRKGQLGRQHILENNKLQPVIWNPRPLDFDLDTSPLQFAVGRDYTILYNTNSHEVKVFGKAIELGAVQHATTVKSMWSSVHFLVESDKSTKSIKSFGNNSHGQLIPRIPIQIEKYEIGSEHGIILTPNNEVFAWGWGEHGNCGVQQKENGEEVTFDYFNCLYCGSNPIVLLGCGCATTWVVIEE